MEIILFGLVVLFIGIDLGITLCNYIHSEKGHFKDNYDVSSNKFTKNPFTGEDK